LTDALLLDYNGVIVDDERLHGESFRIVLAAEGIALDEAGYLADYLGLNDTAAFREAFRRHGLPRGPARIRRLAADKAVAYASLIERGLPLVPGVVDFVRAAAEVAHIAVVSGAIRAEIEPGLAQAGIADIVGCVVCADDVPVSKPDPAGFLRALRLLRERHGGGTWRALVIEDSLHGLAAARAMGAGCIMLTTSYDATHLGGADRTWASFVGHSPEDLATLWRTVAA